MTITQQQALEALERVYYATHASFIDRNLVRQYIDQSTAQPQAVVPAPVAWALGDARYVHATNLFPAHEFTPDAEYAEEWTPLYDHPPMQTQPSAQAERAPVVQATSDTARRLAAEFRGTVARKDFEAWGEEVLPLLDGMAAAPVVQAVQAGDAVLRKHVLLMLDGMGEQVNATPSTPGNRALQKGMRMAIGTAIDRVKSLPGADESRTFMGEPVVSPRPIGFVVLNHFGPNKHLFSSFYDTRNSEHEWAPVFADRASSGATPADVRMLTGDEHEELENALGLAVYLSVARVIQQKFCEVNAGKRIPADGVIGGV